MAIGLGVMGFPADVFWNMTARELEAVIRGRFGERALGGVALSQGELGSLMRRFPDQGAD